MTNNVSKFNTAGAAIEQKAHNAGYKKGIAAVNFKAEFLARGINFENQNEK